MSLVGNLQMVGILLLFLCMQLLKSGYSGWKHIRKWILFTITKIWLLSTYQFIFEVGPFFLVWGFYLNWCIFLYIVQNTVCLGGRNNRSAKEVYIFQWEVRILRAKMKFLSKRYFCKYPKFEGNNLVFLSST